jgi:cell division protein FtsW
MLFALAVLASRVGERWTSPRRGLAMLGVVGVPIVLVLLQPNFGTAMTMGLAVLAVLVLAGLPWGWLLGGAVTLVGVVGAMTLFYRYPVERVLAWLRSLGDFDSLSFQIQQGLIALGSGGILGVGWGNSLQKRQFVPDPHTDLIFAIIGEELGFLGLTILLLLFGFLIWRGLLIARRAPDLLGFLLAAGITIQIGLYFFINAGVATGLLPVTGLPLPFVSYGGSALMANLISVGVLLSISRASGWVGARAQRRVMTVECR